MTGKELIIYILQNDLENVELFDKDGVNESFAMTIEEAAANFRVGTRTMRVWVNTGFIRSINIGGKNYILFNEKDPRKDKEDGL